MRKPKDKAAGWKPDPCGSESLRYWNGSDWTQRLAEPTGSRASPPAGSPATPNLSHSPETPDSPETPGSSSVTPNSSETRAPSVREKNPWKLVAISAIAFAVLLFAATTMAVVANQPPDEKIGRVTAPGFDPELAGGGLWSSKIGADVLLGSLRSSASTGFQILQDGIEENVIYNFKQIQPSAGWDSEFEIDSGLKLRFRNKDSYVLVWDRWSSSEASTADAIGVIASRYGFLDRASGAQFDDLSDRTVSLLDAIDARSLTIGVTESDLAAESSSLALDWDAWISENVESIAVPFAKSSRDLAKAAEELAASPSDSSLNAYNEAIDRYNNAVDEFNESV